MYSVFLKLLQDRGVRTADVSKATGIGPGVFSDWKSGRYTPKADKMQKIADYFGVSVGYLMTGEEGDEKQIYYFTEETAKMAQKLFENQGMRILFDAAQNSRPEDLKMAADLLERLKGTNTDA